MAPTSAFTTTSRVNCCQLARSPRTSGRSITIRCPLAQDWLFALIAQADAFEIVRLRRQVADNSIHELFGSCDLKRGVETPFKPDGGRGLRTHAGAARRAREMRRVDLERII